MWKVQSICFMIFVCVAQAQIVLGKGDSYSPEELRVLGQFRERMKNDILEEGMSENEYLIRFLRARQMNLDNAEEMLHKTLKFRKDRKLDTILTEDFSWWIKRYPFYHPTAIDGRPTLAAGIGEMNFKAFVVSGKGDKVLRYMYYVIERGVQNIRKVSNESGIEYINGHLLFNLAGYNARNHACVGCIPFWIDLAQNYERYYPGLANLLIGINAPRLFEFIVQLVSPLLAPTTQKSVRLYGYDRLEWQRELLKIFPAEELTAEFGGSKKLSRKSREKPLIHM